MKVNVETLETNRVQMNIEVEAQDFGRAVDQAYKKLVKSANIPGFRKGKAPRFIFDRFVGKGILYEEAFEILFPSAYSQAVDEAKVEPVDQPDIDIQQMEEGKPLLFQAKVTIKPEVTLGDYTTINVVRLNAEVTPDEIDAQIEYQRSRLAQLVPVDGPVEKGCFVTFDFEGFIDGTPFEGGAATDYVLEIGSGRFIPGFEAQMVGMAKDEERDINVAFPQDYQAENLAGKDAVFKVKVKEIKKRELPEVNDEFARTVAQKDTVQELRELIEKRLVEEKGQTFKRSHQNEVVRQAVNMSSVEIPQVMVEREADSRFRRFLEKLEEMRMTLDDYCARMGQTVESIRKEMGEGAQFQVKTDLVVEAIAKKEDITAAQEELDASVSEIAARYKQDPATIKSVLMSQDGLSGLRTAIVTDKTIALLAKIAMENAEKNPKAEAEDTAPEAPAEPEESKQ